MERTPTVIEIENVVTRFGQQVVHDGVSFDIERGTLVALIGGCAAPMKSGAKEPCTYPNPYSC